VAAQAEQDPATTPLLIAFRRFPSNFPPEQQKKLRDEGVTAYQKEFVPAWQKLLAFLQTTYAPKERPEIGLSSLPNGREYYAILVRRLTTTNTAPGGIHKIGEAWKIPADLLVRPYKTERAA